MKRFFFLMIALATVTLTASAQDDEEYKSVYINPHVSLSYLHLSSNENLSHMTAGGLGCDVEFRTGNLFGVSVGADLSENMTGYKVIADKYQEYGSGVRIKEKFTMLNFPVLGQFHFGGFAVKAGVQPQLLVAAKVSYQGSISYKSGGQYIGIPFLDESNFKSYYNTFSLSIPVGVSYTFELPITVDLRCNIPVTKLSKSSSNLNQRLLAVMLSLGYRF